MKPLVSVVVDNLNESFYINRCLGAIKKQNYKKVEIIIVGTTDDTEFMLDNIKI